MPQARIRPSSQLANVHYEIRGPLARRAAELERAGYEIIKLNIGNPGAFGFRAPETLRLAMIENLRGSDAYCHQKGIFPAREAVVMETQNRGVVGVTAEDVFMGNGVSELILMTMEALLEPGDEVLLPAPDYPLWTASVVVTGAKPVYYACRPENGCVPDPDEIARLVTPRAKAIVVIDPNNPTGAVYPKDVVARIARIAEERRLVLFSDEIYDRILYDGAAHHPIAPFAPGTLCGTFGGLSKVHRACGLRAGWLVWSGAKAHAAKYIENVELLASLRLCANVPAQWAVPAALAGPHTIDALTAPDGRLGRQRAAVLRGVAASKHLTIVPPRGALYGFVGVKQGAIPGFDDARFAMALLERKHVLVVPGSSFNVDYRNCFRVTLLPPEDTIATVFARIESLLDEWAAAGACPA